jgi:signal transduction histidine kinase
VRVQQGDSERRWLAPAGLAVVGLVLLANAFGQVGLGTEGDAALVTVGCALYAATAVVFLLWFDAPPRLTIALLLTMAAAATLIHHGDPDGPVVGLYLGTAFAPLRLPARPALLTAAAGVALFDFQLLLEASNGLVFALVVTGGAAFFYFLGTLLRREQQQRQHIAHLLTELEASREAEKAAAALAERSRLSREMHDVLAHTLSGLVLQLDGARLLARRGADPQLASTLDRAQALAKDGLSEARQAVTALRGEHLPGPETLPTLIAQHNGTDTGQAHLTVTGQSVPLPPQARLAVYRTAQEALSNVRKHAPGATVDVRLDWCRDQVALVVEDGGPRPDLADPSISATLHAAGSGYGLTGMAERAQLAGGSLTAEPTASGFRVRLTLPVRADAL